ncbi:hypothetical protein LPJ70_004119, partial [Coemansia sp. RSA 2708]
LAHAHQHQKRPERLCHCPRPRRVPPGHRLLVEGNHPAKGRPQGRAQRHPALL